MIEGFTPNAFTVESDILNKQSGTIANIFKGSALDPNAEDSIWKGGSWSDAWNSLWGQGGGDGGGVESVGGLSETDRAFIDQLYSDYGDLPDQYTKYSGNRYADISPEEQATLNQLKGGGGYKDLYDTAQTNLGLSGDVYKKNMNLTNQQLLRQAQDFSNPFQADVEGQITRQLSQGLAGANMQNQASAFGSGAGGGSRVGYAGQPAQEALFRGAGDALGNLKAQNFQQSLNQARQANQDRMSGASAYGNYVNQDLGLGVGGLDKDFGTKMGAFAQDRANQQQDLDFGFEEWGREQMFPWTKLSFGGNLIGGLPLEQKTAVYQQGSGGK